MHNILVFILLVMGVWLRLYDLEQQSLWIDELFSATTSDPGKSLEVVYRDTVIDVHPPLYQVLLHYWFGFMDFSDYAGRLLSVVFGSLTLLAIYFLGRELFSREVGLIALFIAVPNNFLITYSQELRSYALLALLAVLSLAYFYKTLGLTLNPGEGDDGSFYKSLAIFSLLTACLLNTHLFGFLVLAAEAVYFFLQIAMGRLFNRRVVMALAVTFLVGLLAIAHYIPFLLEREGMNFWIKMQEPDFFGAFARKYFGTNALRNTVFLLIAVAIYGALKERKSRGVFLLLAAVVIPLLLAYVYSALRTPILTTRNTIIVVPPLIVLAACGLSRLRWSWLYRVAVLLVFSGSLYFLHDSHFYDKKKEDWRGLMQHVSGTAIPLYALQYDVEFFNFYLKDHDGKRSVHSFSRLQDELRKQDFPDEFWVLAGHKDYTRESWPAVLLDNKALVAVEEFTSFRVLAIRFRKAGH